MPDKETNADIQHHERVNKELKAVSPVPFIMNHFSSSYLPRVIHKDEHIRSAIFGRLKERNGLLGELEGMLVATDERIIFIKHMPGYTTMDELSYGAVSGVNISTTVFNASVTLYTKVHSYLLSFVNQNSAKKFAEYIEMRLAAMSKPPREVK